MDTEISWFGIDFGTTNSAAYSFTGYSKETLKPISYGDKHGRPFPSVVAVNKKDGSVIVGREAKERRNELTEDYVYFSSIKSLLGSDKEWTIAGKKWAPEDIAAEILSALKNRVEADNANRLREAVMAVPNGFSAVKRKHLRNAAERVGISVKAFIGEPTAAFCSNYGSLKSSKNVVVFDWGGGTLDVTVIQVENGKIRELAASGMPYAGDDIDRKLAEKMHSKFCRKKGVEIAYDDLSPKAKDRLLMKCEQAKCDFSDEEDSIRISLNDYDSLGSISDIIEYDYFALLVEDDVEKAIRCIDDAISKAEMNVANIDRILCVGGSSNLRPLREKLKSKYGEEMLFFPDKVMWDIAKGAAISSSRSDAFCSNQDIGLILSDGEFMPLLLKGQALPCEEKELCFATVDNEDYAKFAITDSKDPAARTFSQVLLQKSRGFLGEHFVVSCYVDHDFVFKLKIRSNYSAKEKYTVWQYDGLRVYWAIQD